MKNRSFLYAMLIAILALGSSFAAPGETTFAGGDGSSFEKAILIQGATEETGVEVEYTYLAAHFPGFTPGRQSLVTHKYRMYDVLTFRSKDGEHTVYFDITEFFGKS